VKAARVIVPVLLLAALARAGGDSLWSPDFKGYLSGGRGLAVGDTIVVQIDASSSLSFSASTNDTKNLTLEFTGGESGNLFSFLPQLRTGGAQSTTGKDSLSLKTQVPVVVTAVNPDGSAQVQGSRSVSVQGKNESVTVSGSVSPGLLDQKGTINFSRLANSRLVYTTFLASAKDVLTQADLQTLLTPAPAAAGTPAAGAAAAGAPAAAQPGAPAPQGAQAAAGAAQLPQQSLVISDARKKELLLLYLNRLIDVVFSQ
jgi:flagellar basal body L-ring protein FlgH